MQAVSDRRQMLFDVLNSIILKGVERAKSQQKQQINRRGNGKEVGRGVGV